MGAHMRPRDIPQYFAKPHAGSNRSPRSVPQVPVGTPANPCLGCRGNPWYPMVLLAHIPVGIRRESNISEMTADYHS